jgi:hypothetical protein
MTFNLTAWLRQGSTGTGIITLVATGAAAALHTPTVANNPVVTIIFAIAGVAMMAFPEKTTFITDVENLLAQLEPEILKAVADYESKPITGGATTGS